MSEVAVAAIVKDAAGNLELQGPLRPAIARTFGAGEAVTVIVRATEVQDEPKRTLDQSAYFYAEPLPKFMKGDPELAGCTPAHAKLILLGRYFGWEKVNDHWLPGKVSTADLTKTEFTGFIDFLIQDGAEKQINVVPPERHPGRRDKRVMVA